MRVLDRLRSFGRQSREVATLHALYAKLCNERWREEGLLSRLPAKSLAKALIDYEGLFAPTPVPQEPDASQADEIFETT